MLRKILIIILLAVVIIAAIFAIQRFLNRDSGTEGSTEESAGVVDGADVDVTNNDVTNEDVVVVEGDTNIESPVSEEAGDVDQPAGDDQGTAGYPPAEDDATVAEGNVTSGEDGAANSDEAGGGVPAEETPLGEQVAVEPGAGGLGDTPAISQPIAFVQPGVPTQHTAANLEWLTQLARCYGTTVADIQAANNYTCPDLIQPGYVVSITNPGNAGSITINDTPCFYYHTVQQGETLYSIASQYGIDYQWLARINAIYNYNYVYAGQQLVIPNPVDPVFTTPPAEPFYYSNCWYSYCPGWEYPPVAVPYNQ